MNIPQQAVCTSDVATTLMLYCCCCCRCRCYNTETELWDKNTYTAGKWRAPEFIVSNNGGFGFSLNPVYCCLYFMYNFIFLFFPMMFCSVRCCCRRIAMCAFFLCRSLGTGFFPLTLCCWLYIFFLRCSTSNDEYGVRTKNTDWRWVRELATLFFLSVSRYILYCSQQNSLVEAVPTLLHHHCLLIIICSWIIRLANCICSSLIFFFSLTLACSVFMLFELLMHHLLHLHFLPFK